MFTAGASSDPGTPSDVTSCMLCCSCVRCARLCAHRVGAALLCWLRQCVFLGCIFLGCSSVPTRAPVCACLCVDLCVLVLPKGHVHLVPGVTRLWPARNAFGYAACVHGQRPSQASCLVHGLELPRCFLTAHAQLLIIQAVCTNSWLYMMLSPPHSP